MASWPAAREPVGEGVSRRTRGLVYLLLAAFVVCGISGLNAWPLTGWRFFSHLRTSVTSQYVILAEAPGRVKAIPRETVSVYTDLAAVVHRAEAASGADRQRICAAWLASARSVLPGTVAVQVERVDQSLAPWRGGHPVTPPVAVPVVTCGNVPAGSGGSG